MFGLFEAAGEKSSISGRGAEKSKGAADFSPPPGGGLKGNSVTNQLRKYSRASVFRGFCDFRSVTSGQLLRLGLARFVAAGREQRGAVRGLKARPQFTPGDSLGKQAGWGYAKDLGKEHQFAVGDAANLQFQLGDGVPRNAPAEQLQPPGQYSLRPALPIAQPTDAGTYHVQRQPSFHSSAAGY